MIRHQWLLIVVIAAGLVGMHHLVHVHSDHNVHSDHKTTMTSAKPAVHPHPDLIAVAPVVVTSPAVSQADCCDPMDMVGHFCLAVLTAITALVVALILAAMWCRPLNTRSLLATVSAVAARAPPGDRPPFIQLCVLRC